MARITIEDCLPHVPNRFELIILAARRSKDISNGARPKVARNNDKNTLVALREIGDGVVDAEELRRDVVRHLADPKPTAADPDSVILAELEAVPISENDEDED